METYSHAFFTWALAKHGLMLITMLALLVARLRPGKEREDGIS